MDFYSMYATHREHFASAFPMLETPYTFLAAISMRSVPMWPILRWHSLKRLLAEYVRRAFMIGVHGVGKAYRPSYSSPSCTSMSILRSVSIYPLNSSERMKVMLQVGTSLEREMSGLPKSGTRLRIKEIVVESNWKRIFPCPKTVPTPTKVYTVVFRTVSYISNTFLFQMK